MESWKAPYSVKRIGISREYQDNRQSLTPRYRALVTVGGAERPTLTVLRRLRILGVWPPLSKGGRGSNGSALAPDGSHRAPSHLLDWLKQSDALIVKTYVMSDMRFVVPIGDVLSATDESTTR